MVLPDWISQVITEVCSEMEQTYRIMGSGASHDCQMINQVVPAGLLFVPSRAGLSIDTVSTTHSAGTIAVDVKRAADLYAQAGTCARSVPSWAFTGARSAKTSTRPASPCNAVLPSAGLSRGFGAGDSVFPSRIRCIRHRSPSP